MKKYQIILCVIILPFQALAALSIADLDVDLRVKQQIVDSFALQESIQQFLDENNRLKGQQGKPNIKGNTNN